MFYFNLKKNSKQIMPVIPTYKAKADCHEFKAHLGYRVRSVSKKEKEMSEYIEYHVP